MSAPTAAMVRAVVEQLVDPAYAGMFTDLLMLRAVAADGAEPAAVREAYEEQADALLAGLVDAVAAEVAIREPVNA